MFNKGLEKFVIGHFVKTQALELIFRITGQSLKGNLRCTNPGRYKS
jgi:hypothetical protein